MNKVWLVFQREYLTRVRKKSFVLLTLLVPVIIIGFYATIIGVSVMDISERQRIAVIDEANLFDGHVDNGHPEQTFVILPNENERSFRRQYKKAGYAALLYIPAIDVQSPRGIVIHSPSAIGLKLKSNIEHVVNRAIEMKRLKAANIQPEIYRAIDAQIDIRNTIDSESGDRNSVAGIAFGVSLAAGLLIYMILIVYGTMVMRGVMEEKTNRIAEVIVSSVRPFQLMLGKILGIGAVGLTQFAIWIVLMVILQLLLPLLFPALFLEIAEQGMRDTAGMGTGGNKMIGTVIEGLGSLNFPKIIFCFLFYFLGGYLLYASLFAAVGSVVSEDQQEAQQLMFPILMPLILGFVIMMRATNEPDSNLAIFGSIFPLTSPIVMMARVTYDVPWYQLASSMILLVLCFLLFTWMTAKIYRTGILMYGKKITWKEMTRWVFRRA